MSGYVYFARVDRMLKVGHTHDVENRISTIRTNCVGDVVLIGSMPGSTLVERQAHDALADFSSHGEWYALCTGSLRIVERLLSGKEERPASPIAERLCALVAQLDLSGEQVAAAIGADPAQVSRWMRGVSMPTKATARRIATGLGVPASALLGASPPRPNPGPRGPSRNQMTAKVMALLAASPLSHLELAAAVGVSSPAISHWSTGRGTPRHDNLVRLLEVLGVPAAEFFASTCVAEVAA